MKKAVQKTKNTTYFRYEFSDEKGRPEGGDIFEFSSLAKLQKMLGEVVAVAQNDGVTVSLTIGQADHFFSFLKNSGLSQKEVENELVDSTMIPLLNNQKASKAKVAKKKARSSSKSV